MALLGWPNFLIEYGEKKERNTSPFFSSLYLLIPPFPFFFSSSFFFFFCCHDSAFILTVTTRCCHAFQRGPLNPCRCLYHTLTHACTQNTHILHASWKHDLALLLHNDISRLHTRPQTRAVTIDCQSWATVASNKRLKSVMCFLTLFHTLLSASCTAHSIHFSLQSLFPQGSADLFPALSFILKRVLLSFVFPPPRPLDSHPSPCTAIHFIYLGQLTSHPTHLSLSPINDLSDLKKIRVLQSGDDFLDPAA